MCTNVECRLCIVRPIDYQQVHITLHWPQTPPQVELSSSQRGIFALCLFMESLLYPLVFSFCYQIVDNSFVIKKGTNPEVDSYSAFWDNMKLSKTNLEGKLTEMGVTDVYVCGIAYDVCVGKEFLYFYQGETSKFPTVE